MNEYGDIDANDEAENIFYILWFISFPYIIQEYVVPDGNKLASGDLVFNVIYKHHGRHKSRFHVEPCKRQESVTESMG